MFYQVLVPVEDCNFLRGKSYVAWNEFIVMPPEYLLAVMHREMELNKLV